MDPLSQAALGAVVGQVAGHRQLGSRAAVVGAAAGALPDVDVLFSINGDYFDQLVLHRGITHSLLFAPVVGPPLAWMLWRWEGRKGRAPRDTQRLYRWMMVVSLALLSHPLLDYLTPYGTQLLLPLSNARFAISAMPIIDPVYTAVLLAGLYWSLKTPIRAQQAAAATLIVSSAYLGYGWYLNEAAATEARRQLAQAGIVDAQVGAFPTVFQVHYRRVVARTPDADRVGFISMWEPCEIAWGIAPRARPQDVAPLLATREGRIFDWFTMGWAHYASKLTGGTKLIRATDLRYGATSNPEESIFSATMTRARGSPPRVAAGRSFPDGRAFSLARLAEDAYAPLCRITSPLGR